MSFHQWCLTTAALVYFTAAWFGVGYHGEDEQRHVIEFAEALRGNIPEEALAIEYHSRIRSMVQPVLCAGVFEACAAIGITDPFALTFVLRLLTAALALWVMHASIRALRPVLSPDLAKPLILLSYFLWFIPVLNIRFTGEAWSGLLLLRGLVTVIDEKRTTRFAWAGIWFGLGILFRPAEAMIPFGVALWLVFVQRAAWRNMLRFFLGGAAVLLLGVFIDSAAYGEPVLTLWNYTLAGLRGDEAWRFTSLPWYQHVLFVAKYAVLPIGLLLLGSFVALFLLRPKHVLVWALVPFLIAHSILPVKELRFLFPLAVLMPWMLITTWEALQMRRPQAMARTIWLRMGFLFAVVNAIALLIGIFTPAGNGRIKLAQAIHDRYGNAPVHIDHLGGWPEWVPPFYLASGSTEVYTKKVIADPKVTGPIHLVIARESLGLDRIGNLERLARATPEWTDRAITIYKAQHEHDPLVLYAVTTQQTGH